MGLFHTNTNEEFVYLSVKSGRRLFEVEFEKSLWKS